MLAADASPTVAGLGIDLELDRPMKPAMARIICGAGELAWLETQPTERRGAELLRLWTAKEALYKADPAQGDSIVAELTHHRVETLDAKIDRLRDRQ